MPKGVFHKGMSKKEIAHNTAVFNVILSNEENAFRKGLVRIGQLATALWNGSGTELIDMYTKRREQIVDMVTKLNIKDIPQETILNIMRNGYKGISKWTDDTLIEYAVDNYDKLQKTRGI